MIDITKIKNDKHSYKNYISLQNIIEKFNKSEAINTDNKLKKSLKKYFENYS